MIQLVIVQMEKDMAIEREEIQINYKIRRHEIMK